MASQKRSNADQIICYNDSFILVIIIILLMSCWHVRREFFLFLFSIQLVLYHCKMVHVATGDFTNSY